MGLVEALEMLQARSFTISIPTREVKVWKDGKDWFLVIVPEGGSGFNYIVKISKESVNHLWNQIRREGHAHEENH